MVEGARLFGKIKKGEVARFHFMHSVKSKKGMDGGHKQQGVSCVTKKCKKVDQNGLTPHGPLEIPLGGQTPPARACGGGGGTAAKKKIPDGQHVDVKRKRK